ncbi:unnamed protein product [Paramecium sonneborni]|uniref:Uncharacterized protein n=1 Tax=Paramecium sonneborni TaxID=65129 RepID=A0A8S1L7T0_9CILI|nr:unnamed protein product [Paramecium sonneborni]
MQIKIYLVYSLQFNLRISFFFLYFIQITQFIQIVYYILKYPFK